MNWRRPLLAFGAWLVNCRTSRPSSATEHPRLLVLRRKRLGDMICTLPLLHELRRHYPRAHLAVACDERGAPIAGASGVVDEVIVLHPGRALFRNARLLRGFDVVIVAKGGFDWSLAATARLSGAPRRIGFDEAASVYYTDPVPPCDRADLHQIDTVLELLRGLGLTPPFRPAPVPDLVLPDTAREFAARIFTAAPVNTATHFVLMNLSSTAQLRFRPEDFAALTRKLLDIDANLAVLFVAAPAGQKGACDLADACDSPRVAALATPGPLELAAVMRRAAFLVTPEGGAAHLAAAVQLPAVVLWSEGPFEKWRSRSERHLFVKRSPARILFRWRGCGRRCRFSCPRPCPGTCKLIPPWLRFSAASRPPLTGAFFGWMARRRPPRPRPIRLEGPASRVLVFTCAGIGDTLTDSVVFQALRETFPQAHLAAVVHRRRRLLVEHNPSINQIFPFHKGPFAFWKLQRELREAGPWDAILHLRGNDPEPRCLSYLLDPDVTVSVPDMTRLGWLCGHHVVQPDWDDTHGVEQTLRIARYVQADTKSPLLVYVVRDEERAALEEKLRTWNMTGDKPRLVLQLGGGRRASWRDWPVERQAELLGLVTAELDAEVFLLGGADQSARRDELARLFAGGAPPYHDLVGRLTLAESAALLAGSRALVSTDTGIMHLGFAVGTRVVALIHCNNPARRVGPYGYGDRHRVLQLPRPPGYRTPADASMADIRAVDVFAALREIWRA